MEQNSWFETGGSLSWSDYNLDLLGRPTILLVEDDGDTRDLLVTMLRLAGFDPRACRTAEEGLEQLREQQFDMVLTDYMLPNRTGEWLLRRAADEGLLDATPAMVVTAHPDPLKSGEFEVICKPFDLDDLVDRVRRRLEKEGPRRVVRARRFPAGRSGNDDGSADNCPDPIELILYVSAQSARSGATVANIKRALENYHSSRVRLTVHDLSKDPSKGVADAVAFTPTLVKRSPGPRTFILGHIDNPHLLLELLEGCEAS